MSSDIVAEVLKNEDVLAIDLAVPAGHKHLRATLCLRDGRSLVLQEATVANLVRGYVTVKTDPLQDRCRLVGRCVAENERRDGFAEWQLLPEVEG